ncbi:hypothetical protein V8C42DRAFT_361897 [Trichoderma barbatum]
MASYLICGLRSEADRNTSAAPNEWEGDFLKSPPWNPPTTWTWWDKQAQIRDVGPRRARGRAVKKLEDAEQWYHEPDDSDMSDTDRQLCEYETQKWLGEQGHEAQKWFEQSDIDIQEWLEQHEEELMKLVAKFKPEKEIDEDGAATGVEGGDSRKRAAEELEDAEQHRCEPFAYAGGVDQQFDEYSAVKRRCVYKQPNGHNDKHMPCMYGDFWLYEA